MTISTFEEQKEGGTTREKLSRMGWEVRRRLKLGNVKQEEKCGVKFEDKELEELLEEDQSQMQEELAESLGIPQQAISALYLMGLKVYYELLKPGDSITGDRYRLQLIRLNKFYKKAALFVLRAIAKHSPELALIVVHNDGLQTIVKCLEDFDPGIKEAAAWALGYIARHNKNLAQAAVDANAIPLLVLCLQEPELYIKQIGASAISDISKHSIELAQIVVDAGAIFFLAKTLQANVEAKAKRQVLLALSSIAKHSADLAEAVIEAEIFQDILAHMAHPDENVSKIAAILTREICKHTFENASNSQGIVQLAVILQEETDDHILAVTVWAIGQIGKYTTEHAKAVAIANLLSKLLELYNDPISSEDLKAKCYTALKQILQNCMYIEALESLLHDVPPNILKYVLGQFSKILPVDARARKLFVTSGGLRKVQEIQAEPGTTLSEYITIINSCFPEEIVRYYSPGYPDSLLEAVEQYQPKHLFVFNHKSSENIEASL
ncbi:Sperm-associated antigen 6 [Atta colombica]|uniref:Sperm-associated antigen 6 n=1 Tax=Atta colombica TaxID=520822 RepID=A0A151I0Y7_9HYME|nr:Sperm-associated antigen 6 [Atta colombica]